MSATTPSALSRRVEAKVRHPTVNPSPVGDPRRASGPGSPTLSAVFGRRQWVAALLVPFGVVASHTLSYLLAHPGGADRARALGSMHTHLAPLTLLGAAATLAALLTAGDAGYRGIRLRVTVGRIAALQAAAFAAMEVGERVADGGGLSGALHEPAVWIGLVVQLGVAWLARWLLRAGELVGATLAARRTRRPRRAPVVVGASRVSQAVPAAPLTPVSRRGPPALLLS